MFLNAWGIWSKWNASILNSCFYRLPTKKVTQTLQSNHQKFTINLFLIKILDIDELIEQVKRSNPPSADLENLISALKY